jgi:microcystin-dependent protein
MNRIFAALLALVCFCTPSYSATLLPPGKVTFTDANGKPLSGGTVAFYLPNTTTPKQTWQDAGQTVLNTNPVRLDSAGRATVYGSGAYRQIVKDAAGNLIWDQLTADTSSSQIAWGGTSTGTANSQSVSATNFTSADGQIVGFIAGFTNTGPMTVVANGSAPIPVLVDGQSGSVSLSGQEIRQGAAILLIYDASRGAFHLATGAGGSFGFGARQNLPAANVTDLGLIPTHNVLITGSATITSFGSSADQNIPLYALTFGGPSTLVGSNSLIVPSGRLSVNQGDTAFAMYIGSGFWVLLAYQPVIDTRSPPGMIMAYGAQSCPAGWLNADGSALSRSTYPALFAAIGGGWGGGDGSTTFNVPDLRGYFLRGQDGGAGRDPGRDFASAQGDSVGPHQHAVPMATATAGSGTTNVFAYPLTGGTPSITTVGQDPVSLGETRPKNVAVWYCIKS